MRRYSEALKNLDESFKIQQKTRLTLNDDFDIAITLNSIVCTIWSFSMILQPFCISKNHTTFALHCHLKMIKIFNS